MPRLTTPSTRCRVGVATGDVTPPLGIYHRLWGAATHDVAEGIHQPLQATALVMAPLTGDEPLLALISLDQVGFHPGEENDQLRRLICERAGLVDEALLINFSHSHSSGVARVALAGQPGGDKIRPFLSHLAETLADLVATARANLTPGWLTWGQGRCNMAANRDFWDADRRRWVTGLNPATPADDTVLVGRVSADSGQVAATLVNYACHPTTLAHENRLISPDYIGAMRDVLTAAFNAPVLFLHGASGDLGPRHGFVGDPAIADRNGRQLGHAAAAAIEALPPAGTAFAYQGIIESGAPLGYWAHEPATAMELAGAEQLGRRAAIVPLARKATIDEVSPESRLVAGSEHALAERTRRREEIQRMLGSGSTYPMPIWCWRLGQAALVAVPNELYSAFQVDLRAQFADTPVLTLGTTNFALGYLPPADTFGRGLYQEQQTPFAAGCLEQTLAAASRELTALFA